MINMMIPGVLEGLKNQNSILEVKHALVEQDLFTLQRLQDIF